MPIRGGKKKKGKMMTPMIEQQLNVSITQMLERSGLDMSVNSIKDSQKWENVENDHSFLEFSEVIDSHNNVSISYDCRNQTAISDYSEGDGSSTTPNTHRSIYSNPNLIKDLITEESKLNEREQLLITEENKLNVHEQLTEKPKHRKTPSFDPSTFDC